MNVRYSEAKPKQKSFRKQFIKANTILLTICLLITASEIAIMALARRSFEAAIKIEEKIARFLYLQFILTNEKCGKSCYCQISVNLE